MIVITVREDGTSEDFQTLISDREGVISISAGNHEVSIVLPFVCLFDTLGLHLLLMIYNRPGNDNNQSEWAKEDKKTGIIVDNFRQICSVSWSKRCLRLLWLSAQTQKSLIKSEILQFEIFVFKKCKIMVFYRKIKMLLRAPSIWMM